MQLFRRRRPSPAPPPAEVYPAAPDAGPRLLVCDDNNTVTQLLEMMFEQQGWRVDVTASGEDGLAAVDRLVPDVVLLDQEMGGGLTGIETARALRKRGYDRPVLLFSAYLDPKTTAAARRLDVVPVSKVDFPAVVRHVEAARMAGARS
ncbi:MAG: response regulator [Actinobacteria bacterium]|nr:response regulator [Actinomycetota bacterium]MCA1722368.1 response regulator [Actinomycetota bacterium]